jgi:hypothetical protein
MRYGWLVSTSAEGAPQRFPLLVGRASGTHGGPGVDGYSPRYCKLSESAVAAWVGVKLFMQASSE